MEDPNENFQSNSREASASSASAPTERRTEFIFNYLLKSLRLKPDKWFKMMATEDYKNTIFNFFSDPEIKTLVLRMSSSGLLIPQYNFPGNNRSKCCYFSRIQKQPLTNSNINEILIWGELSPTPVDELAVLVDEIYSPLISNPENTKKWPKIVVNDVQRNLNSFSNVISQIRSAMKNEMILTMPSGSENVQEIERQLKETDDKFVDINLKTSIESSIIQWSNIVNVLLKEQSSNVFVDGSHPTPMKEIEFWHSRLQNLESLLEQLKNDRVRSMATILELTGSAYLNYFKEMFRNVVAGFTEARDIYIYIKPLAKHFGAIEETEFGEIIPLLSPMMHCVCLLWANSNYYCTDSKITILFQEIANLLIEKCCKFLNPMTIFRVEIEDIHKLFKESLNIFKHFLKIFDQARNRLKKFFTNNKQPVLWTFQTRNVFNRLFIFIKRLETIITFFEIVMEFNRLEKIEIGGVNGRRLSRNIALIFEDFIKLKSHFSDTTYNALMPEDKGFVKDYRMFREKITDFDRKLAALFSQAYDNCSNLDNIFKLLIVIGCLMERSIIREEVCEKFHNIFELLEIELKTVKDMFQKGLKSSQMPKDEYFPSIAGSLFWLFKLQKRLEHPILYFKSFEYEIAKSFEANQILKKFDFMINSILETGNSIFNDWIDRSPKIIHQYMVQPILIRNEEDLTISLNFDQKLEELLREVYFLNLLHKDIPREIFNFYSQKDNFYKYKLNLQSTVEWYNLIRTKVIPVEMEMIQKNLLEIDNMIDNIISTLNWNSDSQIIWKKITELNQYVFKLNERVSKAQKNLESVIQSFNDWGSKPLFNRQKDGGFLNIKNRENLINVRYKEVEKSVSELLTTMNANYLLYYNIEFEINDATNEPLLVKASSLSAENIFDKVDIKKSKSLEANVSMKEIINYKQNYLAKDEIQKESIWLNYQKYVDDEIKKSILSSCLTSIKILSSEMDQYSIHKPLFEMVAHLNDFNIACDPNIDLSAENNIMSLTINLINDIIHMTELIPCVTSDSSNQNYQKYIETNETVINLTKIIKTAVTNVISKIEKFLHRYDIYFHLWTNDKTECLNQFLTYSRFLTADEIVHMHIDPTLTIPIETPTNDSFREQINTYEDLYVEIKQLPSTEIFDSWLQLNLKPLNEAVLQHAEDWGNMFKNYLVQHVESSLRELDTFTNEALQKMNKPVNEDDYETLINVMSFLNKVKERTASTDNMFEPLKEIIDLLKCYQVEFEEDIYLQLQELPERWNSVKTMAIVVKQTVAPLQQSQVALIKKDIALFELRQTVFRENFKELEVFSYDCSDPYGILDEANRKLMEIEIAKQKLCKTCQLFEIPCPDFKQIQQCRRDIRLLKQLWDYILSIQSCVNEWKKTLWQKIDVELMEIECKKFSKEIRLLDKEMRSWNPYIQLEAAVKNMLTSLRAVTELQNPSIRDRHWAELMTATKVKFAMNESTTLADLLDLNLHKFEDEVKHIVDKSIKEMGMEKGLNEMNLTWSTMELEYETHKQTGAKILKVTEDLVEILEDNQVQLQNMMSSKFIDFFYSEVSEWQKKLSNTDQVIGLWIEVQRKWMYLESIFIGSEDIRNQLPKESQLFDEADKIFRLDLLEGLQQIPNVVEATNVSGLYEKLELLLKYLVICEKALNDYLETKRLIYPRFYFVSSSDLLDILSNGNNPELVAKHLTKLYDSLAKLRFEENVSGITKTAIGMYSKDDEYVKFLTQCDCTGKVEIWLNRLTNMMRTTLHASFKECFSAYIEKVREIWVFDWPSQAALCCTQIWWNIEVNAAFSKLEEGFEYALKDYLRKQINQLNNLINLLLSDLSVGDRQKIMTICTIDVHSRDVVNKMIVEKIDSAFSFQWQSQLRHRWDEKEDDCFANICDAQFRYDYEYLGNTPRLVITPLTDRCYITLTQSLHLVMGGAPAGPAGTGKTETTKDLGKALGVMVYVFNCSEQMDYRSCGNIYKGLAQTGAWGCFDEFNRISVEVLSVVAVQVKTVLDAIKFKKKRFNFMGEEIVLMPKVGMFITMNPGYAGRAELPENLKALFRPCAMVVPDFALICEIMLVAEGFQDARILARKFITLYTLCRELLSKQDHYDWGLRAIKSVLVVAGALKRGDRQRPEDQVLMRALRDFNIPKIITDDITVFMGLIGDLFPALDVPRKRDIEFEQECRTAAIDLRLQPEEAFILKVIQLQELFEVRHSVFIVGYTGTGKSEVWRTLYKCYHNLKRKPFFNDLNPKAVTNDELFGFVNPATREWRDGLISVLMREQAQMGGTGSKWLVLDGDIDPTWIESLNTVMDDNKVLTLASNERIALTPQMRLLFEICSLKSATPATVSRAGILYINPQDLGWKPYATSWIENRNVQAEKSSLNILFDKYVNACLDVAKTKFKKITPTADITHIEMLCHLLDCLLTPVNTPIDCPKEWYEMYFVFACVWAFGSVMFQDQIIDWRSEFSKWWITEFKTIQFPSNDIFNYFIDTETKTFLSWSEKIRDFELDMDIPLSATLVDTSETARYRYFMGLLMPKKVPLMLIGNSGSGKSVIVNSTLESLSEQFMITNVPFNFYTTSEMLQRILEKPLEKKAGRNYGPPGNKQLIYFIDDMNMPEVDKYGTVQPHTLIRQHMDYGHWYDRVKISLKDIHNVQYISCMNPTVGSFTIDPRLQRHFSVFAVSFPAIESLHRIYKTIITQHLSNPLMKFPVLIINTIDTLINVALLLHSKMAQCFLPTAAKFHYMFNLRDLSNIFQGMLFTTGEYMKCPTDLYRLYLHEIRRVYGDKLVTTDDEKLFEKLIIECFRKGIEEFDEVGVFQSPLIFAHFAEGIGDSKYMPIASWEQLNKLLETALLTYNDLIGSMNLVLFEDAMLHVCRINRILESPRGNALLVGVGGSGKQSLARLAASIAALDVFQVQLRKGYSMADLKFEFTSLYTKAGLKSAGTVFLMSDAQVAEEQFLVVINDILASGEIPELFTDDEIDTIINSLRNEVKGSGVTDSKENCWKFFIERVRRLLKIILCFSPVGSTLRIRARKFPAVVNCTSINWFHEWPKTALESVSQRFLSELEVLPKELIPSISLYMSYVHMVVNEMSETYLQNEKRYNYTTPKSFLEQIELYSKLLTEHVGHVKGRIERLSSGLTKLTTTANEVERLKKTLASQQIELEQKNRAAEQLIKAVSAENEKVTKEKDIAAAEEANVRLIEEDVTKKAEICAEDLQKAEPALIAAQEALNTLNKNNLTELKSFGSPPQAVVNVCSAVLVLLSPNGKIPRDRSWKISKGLMVKVDQFLYDLINYDKENIHPDVVKAIQPYITDKEFDPDFIMAKSSAAAGLCAWVINIMKFYDVYVVVEPKRKALNKANEELNDARNKLEELNNQLRQLEQQLAKLKSEFEAAVDAKLKCQHEADTTATTITLANRLVNGLASENIRWKKAVIELEQAVHTLPGDILQVSAFISYAGCFTRPYRLDLVNNYWKPYLENLSPAVPKTKGLDPLNLLTDDAQIAVWNNEGLPNDRMSTENATILTHSKRWPLIIDPQLQGLRWIKTKYGNSLSIIRLSAKYYLDSLEKALSDGSIVLIENIGETIDAVLDPLLGRILIKKGRIIKIGDKEMDYNSNFRLILHTKLANPHYKPEMQAQCTLINFTVTRDGLEDQLLAEVVKAERPDLEAQKAALTTQQNYFKITLKTCEDSLLTKLSSATGNILGDVELIENLETTKRTAAGISIKVAESKITSIRIDEAREQYRPAATRASLLYFILNDLYKINPIYQFSLKAFTTVFNNAILTSKPASLVPERVSNLIDNITFSTFMYTNRGLFEKDKLIFMAQMALQILSSQNQLPMIELDFLLRYPIQPIPKSPVDFLTLTCWSGIKTLASYEEFSNIDRDIESSPKRWRKFVESECPEKERFPQDWKNKTSLQRLCIMRALRPDRMSYAVKEFIEEKLGKRYVEAHRIEFKKSFEEASSTTSIFFILSPGVDPTKDVEDLGRILGYSMDKNNLHNISLGQGQEEVAENAMEVAAKAGHWVILQNVHLVASWLLTLDKKMEQCQESAHPNYRLFISAEPAPSAEYHILPQGILESSIKITNEPPTGMRANLHKSLDNFNQDTLEMSTKEYEFKSILFSLCYFHAVVAERRKFGPQGWNRSYPFNTGDLTISVYVLYNYLENNNKVPWEDLRYLFGEIMYGGHITDDWDRRLCRTYLQEYMQPDLIDGDLEFAPNFPAPPNLDYTAYHKYIDNYLPAESPHLYGLHPNAEIGFLTTLSDTLFRTILELQPRDAGACMLQSVSREEKVKATLEDIYDKLPELYNLQELTSKVEELTPYLIVALQECERMNILVKEMKDSLKELEQGLKGVLTITKSMEDLEECLFLDVVPSNWTVRAYPSLLGLGSWFADLILRIRELEAWASDFVLPATVWLGGFFNPQSFLTAIMQQTARKNEWPLDKMCLHCDVTTHRRQEINLPPVEGAYISGLFMEGARWDIRAGSIVDAQIKELFPIMPVIYIKAITQDKEDLKNIYQCPVYKTRQRGPTYVWTFNLKTKETSAKWTLGGVAIILQI